VLLPLSFKSLIIILKTGAPVSKSFFLSLKKKGGLNQAWPREHPQERSAILSSLAAGACSSDE